MFGIINIYVEFHIHTQTFDRIKSGPEFAESQSFQALSSEVAQAQPATTPAAHGFFPHGLRVFPVSRSLLRLLRRVGRG